MLLTAMAALACGGDDGDTPSATAPAATEVARATSAPASPVATAPASPTSAAPRPTTQAPARQTPAAPAADPTPVATVMATPRPTPTPAPPTPTPGPTLRPLLDQTSARTDREVLIALYPMLGRWDQSSLDGWRSDAPLGEWEGVTTDSNGRVTELDIPLGRNRQTIPIPWELGNLANLEVLRIYLYDGGIKGGIPPEWGNLTNLKVLRITTGRASSEPSTFPTLLGGLTNLEELCIDMPLEIPPELGNLANLEVLCLSGVTGEIPAELGNLANLEVLLLSSDRRGDLSGEIPAELGNLVNLEVLHLSSTYGDLSGCVPLELRDQLTEAANQPPYYHRGYYIGLPNYGFCADPRVVAEQMSVLAALYDAMTGTTTPTG